jgi:hypothetical protein
MTYDRTCARCRRVYLRANLVRTWVVCNPGHRHGWVRVIQKICTYCMKGDDAQALTKEVNPKWRMLKAHEKIAGVTAKQQEEEKLKGAQ